MRSRSLGLLGAGLLGLASLSEGSFPARLPELPHAMPLFKTTIELCPEAGILPTLHWNSEEYELVPGLQDPSSAQHIFDEMEEQVKDLETLAVGGVTLRHRESDDLLKFYPEDPVYPGQTPGDSYAGTSFVLVYVNLDKHPSAFTLRIARDGTNIYTSSHDLAREPAQRGFLLFNPKELAPQDYRLHGPAKYTLETLVEDDEDPDGEPRVEQSLEFFIEYK